MLRPSRLRLRWVRTLRLVDGETKSRRVRDGGWGWGVWWSAVSQGQMFSRCVSTSLPTTTRYSITHLFKIKNAATRRSDVASRQQRDLLVFRLRKHRQIFYLQRPPNCAPPSIIQCYSCEECPNKTMLQQRVNCTQDAEYVMTCPRTTLGGIPPGSRLLFKAGTGTNIQTHK